MKRSFVAAFSLLLAMTPVAAASASNTEPAPTTTSTVNSVITEHDPGPDNYWTDERIKNAEPMPMPGAESNARNASPYSAEPPVFNEIPWETVVYPESPAKYLPPIEHKGVKHLPIVGKFLGTAYKDGEVITDYACTATVVTSTSESLLITAGHCVWPRGHDRTMTNTRFIPSYYVDESGDVKKPYGEWKVASSIADICWIDDFKRECDQAFLKVKPRADGTTIQETVGSSGFTIGGPPLRGVTEPWPSPINMWSYPEPDPRFPDVDIDPSHVYYCLTGTYPAADQSPNTVSILCDPQFIAGGASGAGLIEYGQSGAMVIANFVGLAETDERLIATFNNLRTKSQHQTLDARN